MAEEERREAAILRPPPREAAILHTLRSDAILSLPRESPSAEDSGARTRSRHLTTVKKFSIGGDWSAFACRFQAAVRSAKWTDAEALEVLPTLLDDESVRSAPSRPTRKRRCRVSSRKWRMRTSLWTMPFRRFVQRQRAPDESPVAFRGAVLELAMAAYPETEPDLLEPLVLGKMLELSRDLGIPMPVCSHDKLTSRAAAKCLDAQFNFRRWKQVSAWTGGPIVEGGATGWDPKKAVYVPDDKGPQELTAASAQWPARGGTGPRSGPPARERRDSGGAARRNDVECFRCGCKGHFARDCWARIPGPPQQEASTTDVARKDQPGQTNQP
ncbi:uncharacterized protein LOC133361719 [Lethenteron reissneri]|uniref:uncharacterized protein LOC133361719 n=1 Tax=Lethenteron reissneri TaxID=7753 RepID=UPI002AB66373|nr:uncharacterized protein LOC133361719 [Lethenteron reissneri]